MKLARIAAMVCALEVCASAEPTPEALYAEGKIAYDAADYATAIKKWQHAYELSGAPGLLLNLGQAYRMNGDCPHALTSYKEFVPTGPKPDDRKLARDWIAQLEPKCGSDAQGDVNEDRQTEGVSSRHSLRSAGIAVGATGAVLAATGLFYGHRASTLGDEVTADCVSGCSWPTEKSKQTDGQRDASVGRILDGVGVAAIAIGIGMYIYGRRDEPTLAIQPTRHGAALTWSVRW